MEENQKLLNPEPEPPDKSSTRYPVSMASDTRLPEHSKNSQMLECNGTNVNNKRQHEEEPLSQIIGTRKLKINHNSTLDIQNIEGLGKYINEQNSNNNIENARTIEDMSDNDSYCTGVLSDDNEDNRHNAEKTNKPLSARVNLNTEENLANIPDSTRQVFLHNDSAYEKKLASLSPIKIKKEIDLMIGKVENVEHRRNGSLLITTRDINQVKYLTKIRKLPISNIAVKGSIAWSTQTVSGKLFAPELAGETLEEILQFFKPNNVVAVRKMFQDPARARTPLFVLTFLGKNCPAEIKAGYSVYKIDTYYPTPSWCTQCCRWGHTQKHCHGALTCNKCSKIGHKQDSCTIDEIKCRNCKGKHESKSKNCPIYKKELEVCKLKTDNQISFTEARKILSQEGKNTINLPQQMQGTSQQTSNTPTSFNGTLNQHTTQTTNFTDTDMNNNNYGTNYQQTQIHNPPNIHSLNTFPHLKHTPQRSTQLTNEIYFNTSQQQKETQPITDYSKITRQIRGEAYNHYTSPSQEEKDYLTPAQRTPQRNHITGNTNEDSNSNHELFSLLSPLQNTNYTQQSESLATQQTQNPHMIPHTNSETNNNTLIELLIKLLPTLIKLFMAQTVTDKIECFLEIGQCLQAETLVSKALSNLGITSLNSTN